ncbi:hypothetical protein PYCCODRAFT_1280189 [Trametes coccinea BRFM310]|uniref:Uncharacterized protein n=1 Tax=Trametes coccinea (strain BRFM310) TaxID=1353009 RepID=A0A1Y2IWK6_TRAC3|nr:hypothetical protein PYCCODRAFT_1280189 [Trametes coccinea BRFM310]
MIAHVTCPQCAVAGTERRTAERLLARMNTPNHTQCSVKPCKARSACVDERTVMAVQPRATRYDHAGKCCTVSRRRSAMTHSVRFSVQMRVEWCRIPYRERNPIGYLVRDKRRKDRCGQSLDWRRPPDGVVLQRTPGIFRCTTLVSRCCLLMLL